MKITKIVYNGPERRRSERREKDGTPEERNFMAQIKRALRIKTPVTENDIVRNELYKIIPIIIVFLILFCIVIARADEPLINMNKIMMIESGGNPLLKEKWGGVGLFQITPETLYDFNDSTRSECGPDCWNIKGLTMDQMFNPKYNRIVADWYLNQQIPSMLKHFHKKVNTRNIIIAYNAGISYVVHHKKLPKTTIKYLRKYGVK